MTLDLTVARQMVGADLLRLRKKRGLIALAWRWCSCRS